MAKQLRTKSIDLGALQDTYNQTRKVWLANARALEKAQRAYDESAKAYHEATDALKAGSRAAIAS